LGDHGEAQTRLRVGDRRVARDVAPALPWARIRCPRRSRDVVSVDV
jgi:hypothetical protein